jgi:hypothetical protein
MMTVFRIQSKLVIRHQKLMYQIVNQHTLATPTERPTKDILLFLIGQNSQLIDKLKKSLLKAHLAGEGWKAAWNRSQTTEGMVQPLILLFLTIRLTKLQNQATYPTAPLFPISKASLKLVSLGNSLRYNFHNSCFSAKDMSFLKDKWSQTKKKLLIQSHWW